MGFTLEIYQDKQSCGIAAGKKGAEKIREAIARNGEAFIIIATGASQFDMLEELVKHDEIDWTKVTMFHLDEYVGISDEHPASFRKYIRERFIARLPDGQKLKAAYLVDGSAADPQKVCDQLDQLIKENPIDVAFIGIGENGHIAFNDPPADFDTEKAYLVVNLDEVCRRQQLGEGWFPDLNSVPEKAISMSPRQIMKSKCIINTVPDSRKAYAVKITVEGELCPEHPASIIRVHQDCITFCDMDSAAQLSAITRDFCRK